jgi:hypothetical protein
VFVEREMTCRGTGLVGVDVGDERKTGANEDDSHWTTVLAEPWFLSGKGIFRPGQTLRVNNNWEGMKSQQAGNPVWAGQV